MLSVPHSNLENFEKPTPNELTEHEGCSSIFSKKDAALNAKRKRGEVLNATLWCSIKVLALVKPIFRSACIAPSSHSSPFHCKIYLTLSQGRGIKDRAKQSNERTTKFHVAPYDFKQVRSLNSGWTEVQLSGGK